VVVCTTRPELFEHRPGWSGGKRNAATFTLAPLSDAETEELVTTLVGEIHPDLLSHAGGNPLYAEEYVRMLAQSANGGELTLPKSVQGIIAARLDTLPSEEKALVQDASVLGKVFWFGELAHVTGVEPAAVDERLRALERKEFVRRERRSSVSGETAYVFRHALVRDVAYSAIPRGRRATPRRGRSGRLLKGLVAGHPVGLCLAACRRGRTQRDDRRAGQRETNGVFHRASPGYAKRHTPCGA